jgi:hypothetical protein
LARGWESSGIDIQDLRAGGFPRIGGPACAREGDVRMWVTREDLKHCGILCGSIVLNTILAALFCTGIENLFSRLIR